MRSAVLRSCYTTPAAARVLSHPGVQAAAPIKQVPCCQVKGASQRVQGSWSLASIGGQGLEHVERSKQPNTGCSGRHARGMATVARAEARGAVLEAESQSGRGGESTTSSWTWSFEGKPIRVHVESWGPESAKKVVLLLPALSDVSTTDEWREVAEQLAASGWRVVSLDWPGFGLSDRPKLDYNAEVMVKFLGDMQSASSGPLTGVPSSSLTIVGAGHAASLALRAMREGRMSAKQLAMVAPTWAGPLPIVFGRESSWESRYAIFRGLLRSPGVGWALYKYGLTSPKTLKGQYLSHVYGNKENVAEELLEKRGELTRRDGARYAPASFVTGLFDPVTTREAFLDQVASVNVPLLVVSAKQSPKRSKAEMEALKGANGVSHFTVVRGALLPHEEYPGEVAKELSAFISGEERN